MISKTLPTVVFIGNHQNRVVASDSAKESLDFGPIERRRNYVRGAWRRPNHHEIARDREIDYPLSKHSSEMIHRRHLILWEFGYRVHEPIDSRHANLHRAEIFKVARDGGLGGVDSFCGQQLNELTLTRDRMVS